VNEFYKRSLSQRGYQSTCKVCQKEQIAISMSKIENFMKILLINFIKKHKKKLIYITKEDLLNIYRIQEGLCYITRHQLETRVDIKQRVDNIWNISILINTVNEDNNKITMNDIHLVSNLVYSMKKMYNLSDDRLKELYKNINII